MFTTANVNFFKKHFIIPYSWLLKNVFLIVSGVKNIFSDNAFSWHDYLDASKSFEVPQIMFPHVELTLQSGIEIGMALEVPNSKDTTKDVPYWVATIVMACGPLLRLRYFGGDDRALEFWFNLTKEAAHELGWCVRHNKQLEPPESVLQKSPDCVNQLPEYLVSAKSVPQEMLTGVRLLLHKTNLSSLPKIIFFKCFKFTISHTPRN